MTEIFSSNPLVTLSCALLLGAMISSWFGQQKDSSVVQALFGSSIGLALQTGRITLFGLVWILILGGLWFIFYRVKLSKRLQIAVGALVFVFSVLLGSHLLPGFNNWRVLGPTSLSPDSVPISLYLNFDKPLIGLFFLAWGYSSVKKSPENATRWVFSVTATICLILMGLSLTLGYVRFNFKWPSFIWLWLVTQGVTCLAEEAFFRGFVQEQLDRAFKSKEFGSFYAWVAASLVFGLVHYRGGVTYIVLATIAGLGYGLAYSKTRRIGASLWMHFMVNTIHFVFFSYPALQTRVNP